MTRHLLTKTLLAAGAFSVLAAAPSAMAAQGNTIKAKVKKTQSVTKLANNKIRSTRIGTSRLGSTRLGTSRLNTSRSLSRNNRLFNNRSNSLSFRTSSLLGSSFGRRGFSSPYRSSIGINFNFGSSGLSRYRWSPSAYGFYSPSYGSYRSYQARTTCDRVTLDGYHYGRPALISVKECYNPWDGSYIVQGSERVIDSRW